MAHHHVRPKPAATESPSGTDVTTAGPSINASPTPGSAGQGNILTITSGAQIAVNGVTLGGASVIELYYTNHTAYQYNGSAWYGPITATSTGSGVADPKPAIISSVSLSSSTFAGGAASGTVVGAITVTMASSGTFAGSLSLSGTNASSFQIVGTNLETNGVVASGGYSINIVATQSGAGGSPFTQAETITGSAQTITGVTLSASSFAGGASSGTVVGVISVTMSSGSFTGSLTLSGTNASSFKIVGTNLETSGVVASGSYSINIIATQSGATGSPFTQAETITGTTSSAIAYSTGANPGTNPSNNGFPSPLPLSAQNSAGVAASPVGWPVDAFDDFTGTFTVVSISGYGAGGFTTGATFKGNPMLYAYLGGGAWGGKVGTDTSSNVAMANSLLTFNVTASGSNVLTSSYLQWVDTPWGYWEYNCRVQHGANGSRSNCVFGLWLSGSNWPSQGEYDIIETDTGSGTSGGISTNLHGTNSANSIFNASPFPGGGTWDDGNFHVYGCFITPSYLATYVDGHLIGYNQSQTYLGSTISTATAPPFGSTTGFFGYRANALSGSESQVVTSGNYYQSIVGYEVDSLNTALCPMKMDMDWWRHSVLTPASGGPHV